MIEFPECGFQAGRCIWHVRMMYEGVCIEKEQAGDAETLARERLMAEKARAAAQ